MGEREIMSKRGVDNIDRDPERSEPASCSAA